MSIFQFVCLFFSIFNIFFWRSLWSIYFFITLTLAAMYWWLCKIWTLSGLKWETTLAFFVFLDHLLFLIFLLLWVFNYIFLFILFKGLFIYFCRDHFCSFFKWNQIFFLFTFLILFVFLVSNLLIYLFTLNKIWFKNYSWNYYCCLCQCIRHKICCHFFCCTQITYYILLLRW